METESTLHPVPAWRIWTNPILIRYTRSRLRPRHLVPWALVVGIVVTFLFLFLYLLFKRQIGWSTAEAARMTLLPLLVIQGVLLMFMGTGTVAAGIVQESAEGMVEYQRLTPMTPLAKILGYLFGLPIREYVLSAITLPFLALAVWLGDMPLVPLLRYYGVFLSAVILYHLTGLVAGTVVRKKFLAGRTAQVMVILAYLVLPRFANLGFVFLIYLTIIPALQEQGPHLFPRHLVNEADFLSDPGRMVPWFQWNFTPTTFSYLIQACLIFVLGSILVRKWRDPDSHLLGHFFAVGVYAGVVLLLLGNALPMIDSGEFFPSNREFGRFGPAGVLTQHASFGWITILLVGWALFGLALVLTGIITPSRHETIRGFRRARKMHWRWVPAGSDDASSFFLVLATGFIGIAGWLYFADYLLASRWIRQPFDASGYLALGAAFLLPVVAFQAVLERDGWRTLILATLFIWIVPPLFALILGAAGFGERLGVYIPSVSGLALPFYGVTVVGGDLNGAGNEAFFNRVRIAFLGSLVLYACAGPWLLWRLKAYRSELQQRTGYRVRRRD